MAASTDETIARRTRAMKAELQRRRLTERIAMPFDRLLLPRAIHDAMIAHALAEQPKECCGLLAGSRDGGVLTATMHYPLVNELSSPTRYLSDSRSILDAMRDIDRRGLEEVGVYHSHPTSPAIPSAIDLAENLRGDTVAHAIISLEGDSPLMRVWRLFADRCEELSWNLVEPSTPQKVPGGT